MLVEFTSLAGLKLAIDPGTIYAVVDGEEIPADGVLHTKPIPRRTIIRYGVRSIGVTRDLLADVAIVSDTYTDVMSRLTSFTSSSPQ